MKRFDCSRTSWSRFLCRSCPQGPRSSICWEPSGQRLRVDDAALLQAEARLRLLVLREVVLLGILTCVEVIEDPKELVEPVISRQVLVAVAQVVLAELPGGVAQRLEHLGQGRIAVLDALLRARKPDRAQARAHRVLAQDEGRAARGARRLGVVIHEDHALVGDAVDVRRRAAHHSTMVGADIPHADVIAPDDEDVRLLRSECGSCPCGQQQAYPQDAQYEFHISLLFILFSRRSHMPNLRLGDSPCDSWSVPSYRRTPLRWLALGGRR